MHHAEGADPSGTSAGAAERLWWIGVLLAAGLSAGWSLVRVKPVVLFAVGYGLALAVVAWWFGCALQVRWSRRMRWGLFLVAGCGVWVAVGLSAVRQERREGERQGLARRLLAEFPRTAEEAHDIGRVEPVMPWSRRYARLGGWHSYWPVLLLGEGLLGGVAAVLGVECLSRPRRGRSQQEKARE